MKVRGALRVKNLHRSPEDRAPGLAEDFSGLPPTVVATAGFDPLRDEGDDYARALADAGVETHHRCFDDFIHGFFGMGILPEAMAAAVSLSRQMGDLMHRG